MDSRFIDRINDELTASLYVYVDRVCGDGYEATEIEINALPPLVDALQKQLKLVHADGYKPRELIELLTMEELTKQ